MRSFIWCVLVTLAAAAPARTQVVVQTPWTDIRVGPPAPTRVLIQTPWVTVGVGPRMRLAAPTVAPDRPMTVSDRSESAYEPGAPPPVPLPIAVEPASGRPPTLSEFAATFQPKAGHYEVTLQHPMTGTPVKVSFALPEGTPKQVKVHRRGLDFAYRGKDVSIRFLRGGEVRVRD